MRILIALCVFTSLIAERCQAATISVSLSPGRTVVAVGDPLTLHIQATTSDSLVGWGLDLEWQSQVFQFTGITIGSLWLPFDSLDGDNLSAVAFPDPVSGNQILLATAHFLAIAPGLGGFSLGVTAGDLTEGFLLENGQFAEPHLTGAAVTVESSDPAPVPEPSTKSLIVLPGVALLSQFYLRARARRLIGSPNGGRYSGTL